MRMEKGMKKILSLALTGALVVTGVNVSPVTSKAADSDTKFTEILTADDIKDLSFTYSDKSNIGEEHEVELSDGTKISIKDNGTVRADMTSQKLADEEMGMGINLGNTLEAVIAITDSESKKKVTGTKYDQAWSQPVTTRAYIDLLHTYGINTLRIPVAWSNGDWDDGTYTIQPALLDRVETVVNYALDNGMYVVINDHWDNQWWGQFGACKKDDDGNRIADEETRAAAWVRYERYWTQIAERFKGYSDHLIFEGANEELCERLNDAICLNGPAKGYAKPDNAEKDIVALSGNLTTDECYETTNKINQLFVDTVRKSGGNNEGRFLLIPGWATDIEGTADSRYVMPADSKEQNGVKKLLLSVHYYTPTTFCLDGGSGDYTLEDQKNTIKYFSKLQKFSDDGYGIILGECGVCNPSGVAGSVTQWYYDTFKEAKKYHAVPLIWDTGAYFDRTELTINYKDIAVFLNTINKAEGSTDADRETGGAEVPESDSSVGAYIDKDLWAKKGMHAYMFYQTSNWDYRDAYAPLRALSSGKHSWDYATSNNAELTADVKVTDAYISGDGEYTVGLEAPMSGNSFKMLGISTDIDQQLYGADLSVTVSNVNIDGADLPLETTNAPIKKDDKYSDFMLINVYDKDSTPMPLAAANDNGEVAPPLSRIEITFKISGLSKAVADLQNGTYIDPETNEAIKVDFSGDSDSSAKNPCKNVTAAKKSVSIKQGKSKTITFNLKNTTAGKKTTDTITVKSSNSKVKAKITKKAAKKVTVKVTVGKKAKKKSKAVITLKVGKKSAKTTVKVK